MFRVLLLISALCVALNIVIHRQSRALDVLRTIEDGRNAIEVAKAEREEALRRVQTLEGRAYVVAEAKRRLGLRVPEGPEIEIVPMDMTPPKDVTSEVR